MSPRETLGVTHVKSSLK